MRLRRIAQPVNGFHRDIQRRVKADGVLRTAYIVVNGTGQTYTGNAVLLVKLMCAAIGTIAPDDHQPINATLP